MMALFARLVQLHIWSAPENLETLHLWRCCLNRWLDSSDENLS